MFFRIQPSYWHPYVTVLLTCPCICQSISVLLHINNAMLLSSFSAVFSPNSKISSSSSSRVTPNHSLSSSSTAHSVTKCETVSYTDHSSTQWTIHPSTIKTLPQLQPQQEFVLHWNRMTAPTLQVHCNIGISPHPQCSSWYYMEMNGINTKHTNVVDNV